MLRLITLKSKSIIIHGFTSFTQITHHFSTTTTTSSFATFLVESLGFTHPKALTTSTKLTHFRKSRKCKVTTFTSFKNPISVINLLQKIGFEKSQIRDIVYIAPQILTSKVNTLEPKFSFFHQLGLNGSHLADVISANPGILHRALHCVVPRIQTLRGILGNTQNVITLLNKRSSWIFSCDYIDNLLPNIEMLKKYEISEDKIHKHVMRHPRAFMVKNDVFEELLVKVEVKWGIPRCSKMFLYGVQLLAWQSEKTLESKCRVFKRFGWSDGDIVSIVRKNPNCLVFSEARIESSLEFLVNELGYGPEYLANHPSLLTYSLEKRLVPRYKILMVLKEKGLVREDCPFYTVVTLVEAKFFQKFVLPFEEVHDDYAKYVKLTQEKATS